MPDSSPNLIKGTAVRGVVVHYLRGGFVGCSFVWTTLCGKRYKRSLREAPDSTPVTCPDCKRRRP